MSEGNEHWLGDGVYFFVAGIGYSPAKASELWAEYRAHKKRTPFCAVLKASIEADDDEVLDLTTYEGIRIINYIQRQCAQKLAASGQWAGYVDGFMVNFAREVMGMPFAVVIGNEYIQLEEEDRRLRIRRRTPNCTICAVNDLSTLKGTVINKEWRIQEL